ncbi:hypothetical protein Bca4012_013097 [Brassica carinata]
MGGQCYSNPGRKLQPELLYRTKATWRSTKKGGWREATSTFFQPVWLHLCLLSQPRQPRSSISGRDEQMAKTYMAVSSAATLADAQCMDAAEVIRAEREHLASVVRIAISVRSARDIMTLMPV